MTKPAFASLDSAARREFLKSNYGFLAAVRRNLVKRGISKSESTVSRTWMGSYPTASPAIIEELEAEYQRLQRLHATPADGEPGVQVAMGSVMARSATTPSQYGKCTDVRTGTTAEDSVIRNAGEGGDVRTGSQPAGRASEMRKQVREVQRAVWVREVPQNWRAPEPKDLPGHQNRTGSLAGEVYLTIHEVAQVLAITEDATRRIFRNEPGVVRFVQPGGKRVRIRIPVDVVERVIHRNTVPWPRR